MCQYQGIVDKENQTSRHSAPLPFGEGVGERLLQSLLVRMGYDSETVPHDVSHSMEHLLRLLAPEDEEALTHYYGLFGEERLSLGEIAAERGISQEDMMAVIDGCIRKIAITPEWQIIKQTIRI